MRRFQTRTQLYYDVDKIAISRVRHLFQLQMSFCKQNLRKSRKTVKHPQKHNAQDIIKIMRNAESMPCLVLGLE